MLTCVFLKPAKSWNAQSTGVFVAGSDEFLESGIVGRDAVLENAAQAESVAVEVTVELAVLFGDDTLSVTVRNPT